MSEISEINCPICGRELRGAIVIETTKENGIGEIIFGETPDRNWIECDGCNRIVCKLCCRKPESGCCNSCLNKLEQPDGQSRRMLIVLCRFRQ